TIAAVARERYVFSLVYNTISIKACDLGVLSEKTDDRSDVDSHDIIVVGGSLGAVEALRQICRDLPSDLPPRSSSWCMSVASTWISPAGSAGTRRSRSASRRTVPWLSPAGLLSRRPIVTSCCSRGRAARPRAAREHGSARRSAVSLRRDELWAARH